jgi:hypothetical protein
VLEAARAELLGDIDIPSDHPLTPAQLSRAAAKAVRLACDAGETREAFYIVNSIRHTHYASKFPSPRRLPGLRVPYLTFKDKRLNLGEGVPSRLPSHALLHSLLRMGKSQKAVRLAWLMMNEGIAVRTSTLRAIAVATINPDLNPRQISAKDKTTKLQAVISDELNVPPSTRFGYIPDTGTRVALRLLLKAREQGRNADMKQRSIEALLRKGEIITAALLFILMIKEWQWRKKFTELLPDSNKPLPISSTADNGQGPLEALVSRRLDHHSLNRIVDQAGRALMEENLTGDLSPDGLQALQVIAYLANALDQRMLPSSHLSSLLRIMASIPRTDHKVWILHGRGYYQVHAYQYIHSVLFRLIMRLPSRPPGRYDEDQRFPLNLRSYNVLLQYALRHRLSTELADRILTHMTQERMPPLRPDITTYNILIRAGTLTRQSDIVDNAVALLRQIPGNQGHAIFIKPPLKQGPAIASASSLPCTKEQKACSWLDNLGSEGANNLLSRDDVEELKADAYTTVHYISHLTSTGSPYVIAEKLFYILPELTVVDHPSWGHADRAQITAARKLSRRARLERAVVLGPELFTAVLNALSKAGKTGLAERVWRLAKSAERYSWSPDVQKKLGIEPWCMPTAAYTIMLQRYAAESRMRPWLRSTAEELARGEKAWVPRTRHSVKGWAQYIIRSRTLAKGYPRYIAAYKMARILHKSMKRGAHDIYRSMNILKALRADNKSWPRNMQAPVPDARFFNAALSIFGNIDSHQRSPRSSRSKQRRLYKRTQATYLNRGVRPAGWNPMLQQVVEEMLETGYPIPPGYRRFFFGRLPAATMQWDGVKELDRRPFAFPRRRHLPYKAYSLVTYKTKGLVIRRGKRLRRRRWTSNLSLEPTGSV